MTLNTTGVGHVPQKNTPYERLRIKRRTRNTAIGVRGFSTRYYNQLLANHKYDNDITIDHYRDPYALTYNTRDQNDILVSKFRMNVVSPATGLKPFQDATTYGTYNFESRVSIPLNTYHKPVKSNYYHHPFNTHYQSSYMNFYPLNITTNQKYLSTGLRPKTWFSWHRLGIIALIKVGLVKLKAIAILNMVLFLLFKLNLLKLKLFLIVEFFRFHLVLKLLKFLKIVVIPKLLLPLIYIFFKMILIILKKKLNKKTYDTGN